MIVLLKMMGAVAVIIGVVAVICVMASPDRPEECDCDRCRQVRDSDKS